MTLFCGDMLKEEIIKTGIITKEELDQIAAVPNTAVDRMVFGTDRDGRDGIEIGKDYKLVIEVDKLADPQNLPIKGPEYTDNLKKISREKIIYDQWGTCLVRIYCTYNGI